MKTKEKEIQKKIKELCELMGDDDKFFFFRKNGDAVTIALPDESEENDNKVSAALSSVIEKHFLNKGYEGVDRLSEIIIDSIEALIGVSPLAGAKLTSRFAQAALLGMKMELGKLSEDDDDDDEDDYYNECENCELMRECNDEAAIKYRKEHGIPKPKKSDKGERKMKGGRKSK
jgi:hypothetical protein